MKTILIVEDHDTLRGLLYDLLSDSFRVTVAATAAEAIGCIQRTVFHIVLVDVHLPDMKGSELRVILAKSQPCIVAMTGDYLEAASFKHYISKPFRPECLIKTLNAIYLD